MVEVRSYDDLSQEAGRDNEYWIPVAKDSHHLDHINGSFTLVTIIQKMWEAVSTGVKPPKKEDKDRKVDG